MILFLLIWFLVSKCTGGGERITIDMSQSTTIINNYHFDEGAPQESDYPNYPLRNHANDNAYTPSSGPETEQNTT